MTPKRARRRRHAGFGVLGLGLWDHHRRRLFEPKKPGYDPKLKRATLGFRMYGFTDVGVQDFPDQFYCRPCLLYDVFLVFGELLKLQLLKLQGSMLRTSGLRV